MNLFSARYSAKSSGSTDFFVCFVRKDSGGNPYILLGEIRPKQINQLGRADVVKFSIICRTEYSSPASFALALPTTSEGAPPKSCFHR